MILGHRIAHTIDFSRAIRIGEQSSLTFTLDSVLSRRGASILFWIFLPLSVATCSNSKKKPNANRYD